MSKRRPLFYEPMMKAHPHLSEKDVDDIIECIITTIQESVRNGKRVEIRGFGNFSLRSQRAREGSHPRTGARITYPENHTPKFKLSRQLLTQLQDLLPEIRRKPKV